jgi:hypothetical protein
MPSIEVQLIDGEVRLHIITPDHPRVTISLTPETAIGIGSALIQAGRDAAICSN